MGTLAMYSGEPMEVLCLAKVEVVYASQQATFPLYVVKGAGPSLFGRNWLEAIRPEWESIQTVQSPVTSLAKVLEEHKDVFEGLGQRSSWTLMLNPATSRPAWSLMH